MGCGLIGSRFSVLFGCCCGEVTDNSQRVKMLRRKPGSEAQLASVQGKNKGVSGTGWVLKPYSPTWATDAYLDFLDQVVLIIV